MNFISQKDECYNLQVGHFQYNLEATHELLLTKHAYTPTVCKA